jgi:poly-D-alanine transfer protein DltD
MKMKVKKFSAVLVAFLVAVTSMVLPLSDTFDSVIKTTGSAKAVTKNSLVQHKAIH